MRTVVTTEKMCCYYTENIYQTSSTQQSNLNIPTHQSNAHSSIYDSMMCLNPAPLQQWVGPGFSQNRMRSGLDAPSGALTLVWGESDDPMQVDRETNRLMAFWETPQCRRFALISKDWPEISIQRKCPNSGLAFLSLLFNLKTNQGNPAYAREVHSTK